MTYKTNDFHHNFPNLAEECGFTFNTHKPRVHIEWNKIKIIDIDSIIRDRKFGLLEQHINDILSCVLESEFDVRILDEGVLKIFRLSQLTVEYQQFCRNYLDRSIYVMREEVTNLLKEVETTKRSLREKEDEIRKLKRKSKYTSRTPLPYGNENIATMILKTLNNTKGDIFNSTSHTDVLQYNKCNYCEKVFLNQLYLKSHISRRHADFINIPQTDTPEKLTANENINSKLNEEIEELKTKLKQMEDLIINQRSNDQVKVIEETREKNIVQDVESNSNDTISKEMKDAEVLTDGNIQSKIDSWKKEEYEKYNHEIVLLRKQIIDIISNKEKQEQSSFQNDLKIMEQLQATMKQQSTEILSLKEELLKGGETEKEKRKEIETQMSYWIKQAEKQSNEYKVLLQKLNEVTNEAREYRAQANIEKEKSSKLQDILDKHLNLISERDSKETKKTNEKNLEIIKTHNVDRKKPIQKTPSADLITLSKLQEKAQELLNMNETSTSESSSTRDEKFKAKNIARNVSVDDKTQTANMKKIKSKESEKVKKPRSKPEKKLKNKINLIAHSATKKENGYVHIPSSPMKIMRAKVTEQVNQRLISLGVDPLRNQLPQNTFRKQRLLLQKEQETKTKRFPVREKILHSILAHLDESIMNKNVSPRNDYISPNKSPKTFSLSSVFTNVKTKALSLVKSTESVNSTNKSYNDIAKKAIELLKTPPESANSSPMIQRHSIMSPNKTAKNLSKSKKRKNIPSQSSKSFIKQNKNSDAFDMNDMSDDTNSQSLEQEHARKQIARVVNNLVKSPIRRPTDETDKRSVPDRLFISRDDKSYTTDDVYKNKVGEINVDKNTIYENNDDSSDDVDCIAQLAPRKFYSDENINDYKQTKGVLKNASSTSSLNKKKVIFDMDAIQMKSVSASPSQSITEKSDIKEQIESGINLDTEEWDISSIENEHQTTTVKVQVTSHTSPKIAELKKTIESQLSLRNPTLSTALVGGVDVLTAPIQKVTNFGGSNTSLGSSILDDTDSLPMQNKTYTKSIHAEKDDSEVEISDLINDAVDNKAFIKSY